MDFIGFQDCDPLLDWHELVQALEDGHKLAKAEISDTFLYRDQDTLLSRAAWISGLGQLVKTATIFPGNAARDLPAVNGAATLFSDETGMLEAVIDFHLLTKWKTAGDSLLAATKLARPDAENILLVGAGTVSATMVGAYRSKFPKAQFAVWNRSAEKATDFAERFGIEAKPDLATAVSEADIICTATMTTESLIKGEWLQPGQHLDLIGAYRPDMREVDTVALERARVFVDSYQTTLDHIGELKIPLSQGEITRDHIIADYYDLGAFKRNSPDEITIAKNGGGAHLDLMTSNYILKAWLAR